jgi:hypothetical protein
LSFHIVILSAVRRQPNEVEGTLHPYAAPQGGELCGHGPKKEKPPKQNPQGRSNPKKKGFSVHSATLAVSDLLCF